MSTMQNNKINDTKLIRLVDSGISQSKIAKEFGVSRQAVSKRLLELRGKTTKAVVVKKIEAVVDGKLDAIEQLTKINIKANELLDEVEQDPQLTIKIMAEIRGQLKLQLEIFETLYSLQAVQEFQDTVLEAISEAAPEVRNEIISKLNGRRSLRQSLRFS
jgi:predicted transcriptional regulator